MTKALLVAASLGLCVSAANACEYQRSAAAKVDKTVVASISGPEETPAVPQSVVPAEEKEQANQPQ